MSRYLSEALESAEPNFRRSIIELEKASGHPNSDIRLTSQILQSLRQKMKSLGLDPEDTTPEELYHALNQKLRDDDQKLLKELRTLAASKVNAEANLNDGIKLILERLGGDKDCFVIKGSVLKKQLRSTPPKKVMKNLGYRSVDSLLKHEPIALVVLAINNFESTGYTNDFYSRYKSYKPTDFESRKISILQPKGSKWTAILNTIQKASKHQLISCYELGSLIVMPISNSLEPGQISANLVLLLNEISKIVSTSTYLKLHQVSSDFGHKLYQIAEHEPIVSASLMSRPIPWHLVQSALSNVKVDIDVPHLNADDLSFNKMIDKLGDIVPDFKFWQSTEFLGLVKQAEATSLNILDVATNLSNKLDFSDRHTAHFKNSLWQELISRYITPDIIADSLKTDNRSNLALEMAEI